ncbi:MAG: hypothetical protein ACYDCH_03745 [Gaiellaceae bacterium]
MRLSLMCSGRRCQRSEAEAARPPDRLAADDRFALAAARRERYQELYSGLAKLGVRLQRPPGITPA